MSTLRLHVPTASAWVTTHLAVDSRKYGESAVELAGRVFETTYDHYSRSYKWYVDGTERQRIAVEAAIDQLLNG